MNPKLRDFIKYEDYVFSMNCWLDSVRSNPLILGNPKIDSEKLGNFLDPVVIVFCSRLIVGIQRRRYSPHLLYAVYKNKFHSHDSRSYECGSYFLRFSKINQFKSNSYPDGCSYVYEDFIVDNPTELDLLFSDINKLKIEIQPCNAPVDMCSNETIQVNHFKFVNSENCWEIFWDTNIVPTEYSKIHNSYLILARLFDGLFIKREDLLVGNFIAHSRQIVYKQRLKSKNRVLFLQKIQHEIDIDFDCAVPVSCKTYEEFNHEIKRYEFQEYGYVISTEIDLDQSDLKISDIAKILFDRELKFIIIMCHSDNLLFVKNEQGTYIVKSQLKNTVQL